MPPTDTPAPPTDTPVPPTATPVPPTDTPIPPTATPVPPTPTPVPTEVHRPVVQVVSPPEGFSLSVGQVLAVTSVGADDAGVERIELWVDNVLINATRGLDPRQKTLQVMQQWRATTVGDHSVFVVAYDPSGNGSEPIYRTVKVVPNVNPPKVHITYPTERIVIEAGHEVGIQSTATDEVGVTKIELWADNQLYTYTTSPLVDGQSPFNVSQGWKSNVIGDHELFVRAFDSAGQRADTTHVIIGVADTNPPSISVSVDRNTVTVGEQVQVHNNAVDSKGITRIELWADGQKYSEVNSPHPAGQTHMSATQSWPASAPGQHVLFVRVYDSVSKSANSQELPITVLAPETPTPPPPTPVPPTATPTPTPSPTPVPPTPTPVPVPIVEIIEPQDLFTQHLPDPVSFIITATGYVELTNIELWGYYQGQETPQLLETVDASGTTQKTASFDWLPPGAGLIFFYAKAHDVAGGEGIADTISGYIDVPEMPTETPTSP